MGRTIIVGDVHGCRDELDALLDRVAFTMGDRLVFVGDLIARGPDSLGVLDIARQTGAVIVRGNHEEKVLQWRDAMAGRAAPRGWPAFDAPVPRAPPSESAGGAYATLLRAAPPGPGGRASPGTWAPFDSAADVAGPSSSRRRPAAGRKARAGKKRAAGAAPKGRMHQNLAQTLRAVDWTLLATSPLFVELPEHDLVVVHAGLLPGVPLAQQRGEILMRIRCLTPHGGGTEEKGSRLWGAHYDPAKMVPSEAQRARHVVFGHNARLEPQFHPWATGIDTACVYGGKLTAVVLGATQKMPRGAAVKDLLVSEPARRQHYDWVRKKKVA